MERIYDKKNRYVGYLSDNGVYNKRNELIGYIQDNVAYDANYSPMFFFYNDAFYWMNGMPWGYMDGRTIRDLNDNSIGRARNASLPSIVSAGLLFNREPVNNQYQYQHTAPTAASNVNSGYTQPYANGPVTNANGGFGLGGIMQNIMGAGRSLFGGFNGLLGNNLSGGAPMAGNPVPNANYGAAPVSGGIPGMPPGVNLQNLLNLGRVLLPNLGIPNTAAAPASGGFGPLASVFGQYLLKNPNMAMSLLSRFIKP